MPEGREFEKGRYGQLFPNDRGVTTLPLPRNLRYAKCGVLTTRECSQGTLYLFHNSWSVLRIPLIPPTSMPQPTRNIRMLPR